MASATGSWQRRTLILHEPVQQTRPGKGQVTARIKQVEERVLATAAWPEQNDLREVVVHAPELLRVMLALGSVSRASSAPGRARRTRRWSRPSRARVGEPWRRLGRIEVRKTQRRGCVGEKGSLEVQVVRGSGDDEAGHALSRREPGGASYGCRSPLSLSQAVAVANRSQPSRSRRDTRL